MTEEIRKVYAAEGFYLLQSHTALAPGEPYGFQPTNDDNDAWVEVVVIGFAEWHVARNYMKKYNRNYSWEYLYKCRIPELDGEPLPKPKNLWAASERLIELD